MLKVLSIMKSLSDRNRLRVMFALMEAEELCACQITDLLQVSGATASRHLGLLLNAGILKSRKDGRWIYYRLSNSNVTHVPLLRWLEAELKNDSEMKTDRRALREIVACEPREICRKQRGEACCPKK